nr:glycerophosphodiester phosphodiesterase [Chitinispirillaceae bacterium]
PGIARENTIESFLAAIALGADMIELDIRKTADDVLVVFHDPWLSKKTKNHKIAEMTHKELVLVAKKRKIRIPTAEEAFAALSGKIMLDIELKETGCEDKVIALARKYFASDTFVCTSFLPEVISAIKTVAPEIATGFICARKDELPLCETTPTAVIAPEKSLFSAHRDVFASLKKRGRKIAVWTVDGTELLSSLLIDPVVDAIITNHADRAIALRKKLTGK